MTPQVAVITRTKNRPLLLRRALLSVAKQSFTDYCHVIVNDGGSTNDVKMALSVLSQEEASKVIVITNETSLGMEAASNIGIRACDSKFIVIHDDDDSWQVEFLMTTVNYLTSHEGIMGVSTRSYKVIERLSNETVTILFSQEFNSHIDNISLFDTLKVNGIPNNSFLYRRYVLKTIGMYDESLPVLGDWEFNLRFLLNFDIDRIDQKLANYHHRPQQSGSTGNTIINGISLHKHHRNKINNRFLRSDIESKTWGIGVFINMNPHLIKNNLTEKIYRAAALFILKFRSNIFISTLFKDKHSKNIQLRFHPQKSM